MGVDQAKKIRSQLLGLPVGKKFSRCLHRSLKTAAVEFDYLFRQHEFHMDAIRFVPTFTCAMHTGAWTDR